MIGPTDPSRLYSVAASVDPDGRHGGPLLETLTTNRQKFFGRLTYTTMPEQLQARGITWKVYSSPDSNLENNVLWFRCSSSPRSAEAGWSHRIDSITLRCCDSSKRGSGPRSRT